VGDYLADVLVADALVVELKCMEPFGELTDREDEWRGPQRGSMDPMQGEKIVCNYRQKQNAESDDSTVGPRYTQGRRRGIISRICLVGGALIVESLEVPGVVFS